MRDLSQGFIESEKLSSEYAAISAEFGELVDVLEGVFRDARTTSETAAPSPSGPAERPAGGTAARPVSELATPAEPRHEKFIPPPGPVSSAPRESIWSSVAVPSNDRRAWPSYLLPVLLCFTTLLTIANLIGHGPFSVGSGGSGGFDTMSIHDRMKISLKFEVLEIADFKEREGHLPGSLSDLGITDDGLWMYEPRPDDRYRLTIVHGDSTITYDSAVDPDRFFSNVSSGGD